MYYISHRSLTDECKQRCKKYSIELYGWTGSLSVITAYGLTSLNSDKLLLIDSLNLYGSLSIGYMCWRSRVWQAVSLEIGWFIIGSYSLIMNILDEKKDKC